VVSLRYGDLLCELPTKVRILVWPMHHLSKKQCTSPGSPAIPVRLPFAEDAFRIQSLPEGIPSLNNDLFKLCFYGLFILLFIAAYAEIMPNMPNEIRQLFQTSPS